jgi:hypothetical protein
MDTPSEIIRIIIFINVSNFKRIRATCKSWQLSAETCRDIPIGYVSTNMFQYYYFTTIWLSLKCDAFYTQFKVQLDFAETNRYIVNWRAFIQNDARDSREGVIKN